MSTPVPTTPARDRVYLDHAANAPLRAPARTAMSAAMAVLGNPSALHTSARHASARLDDAREQLAEAVGAHPSEVILTSGASEANSIAVLSGMAARSQQRPRLVVGATEHPSVATAAQRWGRTTTAPVDADGRVLLDLSGTGSGGVGPEDAAGVGIVAVQVVNSETGVVQPVQRLAEQAHAVGAWFHTDAVQAIGHVPFDFAASGADMASLSAHKFGGPVGVGALLVRRHVELPPWGLGGGQEAGVRSGTQSVVLAAGMAAAAAAAVAELDAETRRLRALRARLVDSVRSTIDRAWANPARADDDAVSPAIVNITFDGARADDVLLLLDRAGIDASVGSACRAGVHQPSQVLLAMGRPLDQALSTLRFSLGPTTTDADVEALLAVLPDAVSRARAAR